MTFSHRPLEETDARAVCGFAQTAEELFFAFPKADFPLTPEVLLSLARQGFCPTVVLLGDAVVGYANFTAIRERGYCAIGNLLVHPGFRRMGVATYLVQVMARKAMEMYCARFVRASCFSHNREAYQLYHKLGYRPADMEQRLTVDGIPVLLVNLYLHRRNLKCTGS